MTLPSASGDAPFDAFDLRAEQAVADFLTRYKGRTRETYAEQLLRWFQWCADHQLPVLEARRVHVVLYVREIEEDGISRATVALRLAAMAGFYRFAVIDGIIERSPLDHIRRPMLRRVSRTTYLRRNELRAFLGEADRRGPDAALLAHLLALNGLRLSEVCGLRVEAVGEQDGFVVLTVVRKGGWKATVPLAPRTAAVLGRVLERRSSGALLLNSNGDPMQPHAARSLVRAIGEAAGIDRRVTPHALRHTFVTLSLDAGVPLRDVQNSAGHQDPRMTSYYDRNRDAPERNATHRLTEYLEETAD